MNQNPYAPPGAGVAAPGPVPFGQPQPWTTSEALSLAWARFKEFGGVVVVAYLVSGIFTAIVAQLGNIPRFAGSALSTGLAGALAVAGFMIGQVAVTFFQVGTTRIGLDAVRGKAPELGTLFGGGDRFLPLLGLRVLLFLILVPAFLLLVVPFVILALGLSLSSFYVIDAGMGPIEAMKASWSATRGQRGEVFVLGLAGFGLSMLGVLMCCVGMLATVPTFYLALAVAYVRMSGLGAVAPLASPQARPPQYLPPP